MGRYSGKTCRLSFMLCLTTIYFLVEIIVGYITNSMALVADSFHMLSDVIALVIGLFSVRISKKSTTKNTFGWARAEVLGALVNAVFLLALCFSILVESIKRIIIPEQIARPVLLISVGTIGLVINLVGLAVLGSHGHSHGGGGHSHGGHGHGHGDDHDDHKEDDDHNHDDHGHGHGHSHSVPKQDAHAHGHELQTITPKAYDLYTGENAISVSDVGITKRNSIQPSVSEEDDKKKAAPSASSANMNMKGVLLHVLGDALGSVVVIISAVIMWQLPCDKHSCETTDSPHLSPHLSTVEHECVKDEDGSLVWYSKCWTLYVDPAMSIFLVAIILSTTIPLLKESALILLQTVPTHIEVEKVKRRLLEKIAGVLAVHEFHVWQLAGNRIIASAHIHCQNLSEYRKIAEDVKEFFHNEGIHSTTIQPEFVEQPEDRKDRKERKDTDCILECKPAQCGPSMCCGNKGPPNAPETQVRRRGHSHENLEEGQQQAVEVVDVSSCHCQH